MFLQLITFCFCLAFSTSAEVSASCPSSVPTSGTTCPLTGNAWMKCSYNRKTCCPGTSTSSTIYESTAECRNSKWTVTKALCPTTCASTCPSSVPAFDSPCTGNLECQYGKNMTCCNGAVQFSGEIAQCSSGKWRIGVADGCLFGCPETTCPDSVPAFDSPCTGNLECQYGKNMTCCNGAVQFSGKIAQCSSGKWRIGVADGCLFGCAGLAETSTTVKADCPASVPQDRAKCPLTGNAWMTCSFNSTICCPGTAAARTIYQQTADCRNGTWSVGVASCSCPATPPPSTCPAENPSSDTPCTGNIQCQYGKNMTCCNGDVQYSGKIVQCVDGQWLTAIADGCMFACSTQCPMSTPTNGASCTFDSSLSCKYASTTTARCVKGKWAVATSPSTCPALSPASDAPCTGDIQCKYGQNMTCCNGDVQYSGKIVQCVDGKWLTAIADGCLFGCSTQCPTSTPTNGASCAFDTSVSCKYGSATARCVKGKWAVDTGAFTNFCPKTAPTNGQTCSPGASAYIRCQYNSKACSCGGGTIYQTDAWCRSTKLVWEVSSVSCPPCLVQEIIKSTKAFRRKR